MATLVNLCLSLLCVKAPGIIERLGQTKRGAVILSFINLIVWVPLILAFMFSSHGITPAWLALFWLMNIMPGILLSFQRDNWMSNTVPQQTLGRYLGQRLAIKSACYLGAFCLLGYMLDTRGEKSLASFAFVFIIALVMAAVDFVIFTHMNDLPKKETVQSAPQSPKMQFGLFSYMKELKEKKLNLFIGFTSLFYLTVGLSGPLYAVYMLEEKSFTYLSFTVIIAAEYLARVVSAPFWGRYADKKGNIRVLGIVSRVIPAIPIAWLFCANVGYLVFVQTVSGICWGAFDLSTQSYLYKVAPPEKKLKYIVYTRCLILLSTAVGGLAGVYLVNGVFMTFGSRLLTIFMISGFIRALVVMYLMPKLVDLAVSYGKQKASPKVGIAEPGTTITSKRGLFYRQEPAEAPAKATIIKYNSIKASKDERIMRKYNQLLEQKLAKAEAAKKEILALNIRLSQRRAWATDETKKTGKKASAVKENTAAKRQPWYRNPEMTAAYAAKRVSLTPRTVKEYAGRGESSRGLYHDNTGWASYLKETMELLMKERQDLNTAHETKTVKVKNIVTTKPQNTEAFAGRTNPPVLVRVPVYIR